MCVTRAIANFPPYKRCNALRLPTPERSAHAREARAAITKLGGSSNALIPCARRRARVGGNSRNWETRPIQCSQLRIAAKCARVREGGRIRTGDG